MVRLRLGPPPADASIRSPRHTGAGQRRRRSQMRKVLTVAGIGATVLTLMAAPAALASGGKASGGGATGGGANSGGGAGGGGRSGVNDPVVAPAPVVPPAPSQPA